jgi:uncharacterized protein DUF2510
MSDVSQGPGWWVASDGKWYPPELHPDNRDSHPQASQTVATHTSVTPPNPAPSTPPGWYRDPYDETAARYWDGTSWSEARPIDSLRSPSTSQEAATRPAETQQVQTTDTSQEPATRPAETSQVPAAAAAGTVATVASPEVATRPPTTPQAQSYTSMGATVAQAVRKTALTSWEGIWYIIMCIPLGWAYFTKIPAKKALHDFGLTELTAAERFWYLLMCIALGAGYLAKIPTAKAISELPQYRYQGQTTVASA